MDMGYIICFIWDKQNRAEKSIANQNNRNLIKVDGKKTNR